MAKKRRKVRNPGALSLILSKRGGHHGDAKKEESKTACRKPQDDEEKDVED